MIAALLLALSSAPASLCAGNDDLIVDWQTAMQAGWGQIAVLGDVDGDGSEDVVVTGSKGIIGTFSLAKKRWIERVDVRCSAGDCGWALATCDDLDGDGVRDFVVSNPHTDTSHSGRVDVLSGKTLKRIRSFEGFGLGLAVSDGARDKAGPRLAVGTAGAACIYSLRSGEKLLEIRPKPSRLEGWTYASGRFGHAVCFVPDLDGDGFPELAVADPLALTKHERHGVVCVLASKDGRVLRTIENDCIDPMWGGFGGSLASVALGDKEHQRSFLAVSITHHKSLVYSLTADGTKSTGRMSGARDEFESMDGFGAGLKLLAAKDPDAFWALTGTFDDTWQFFEPENHPYVVVDSGRGSFLRITSTRTCGGALPAGIVELGDEHEASLVMLAIGDELWIQAFRLADQSLLFEAPVYSVPAKSSGK